MLKSALYSSFEGKLFLQDFYVYARTQNTDRYRGD